MRQTSSRISGLPATALSFDHEIRSGQMITLWESEADDVMATVKVGRDSAWLFMEQKGGPKLAIRTAHSFGSEIQVQLLKQRRGFIANTAVGVYMVEISLKGEGTGLVRCTQRLTPSADILVAHWPRDLFPIGPGGTPLDAKGEVRASQRGLNNPVVFGTIEDEAPGSFLYFQNLTALNPYFLATDTIPDGRVGGVWPELGYEIPGSSTRHLLANQEVVLNDSLICLRHGADHNPRTHAATFINMLACVYRELEKPKTKFRDWPEMSTRSIRDLGNAPEVTISHYGHTFIRPYVDAEYPDCMCQLAIAAPLAEYQRWTGEPLALAGEIVSGVSKFYDPELGSLRRYLPNVGKDKNKDEVDSWYLYHPLSNLAWLAKQGDKSSRDLFFKCLEFGIKAAQHFKYDWPIQFNVKTLEVIKLRSEPGQPGQSDVGGFYSYLMIQAWELDPQEKYLEEAENALQATSKYEFDLSYQANLVAFGFAGCVRLFTITKRKFFFDQAKVFLASFLHNCCFWQSEKDNAKHYSVWLASACLHDSSYLAMFECADSFVAFSQILGDAAVELDAETRMFLSEFCRHTLSTAWSFYPSELPASALATKIRNGHIDPKLAFPLEDLYPSGQPAGSVGQEVYGAGAAFLYATRTFHHLDGADFDVFCECPLRSFTTGTGEAEMVLGGTQEHLSRIRILTSAGRNQSRHELRDAAGKLIETKRTKEGHHECFVPGDATVRLTWTV